jgi:Protein of unknown function (DUF3592)
MSWIAQIVGFVLVFAMGLGFVAGGTSDLASQRRYRDGGATIQGTVLTVEPDTTVKEKRRKVTYAFTTRDGRELRGSDLVSPQTRRQLREGGPIAIQYLVSDPTTNQIPEDGEEGLYTFLILVGLAFTAVSLLAWIIQSKTDKTRPEPAVVGREP